MPAFEITTNVDLEGIDIEPFYSEATIAIASIIGRPQHLVMVAIKGSVKITFSGNKEPAAIAQLISMGGINKQVKKKLITSLASILHTHLSIHPTRFICHVIDTTAGRQPLSKL